MQFKSKYLSLFYSVIRTGVVQYIHTEIQISVLRIIIMFFQADKDGNNVIDYVEFTKLWSALRGEGEVSCWDSLQPKLNKIYRCLKMYKVK